MLIRNSWTDLYYLSLDRQKVNPGLAAHENVSCSWTLLSVFSVRHETKVEITVVHNPTIFLIKYSSLFALNKTQSDSVFTFNKNSIDC